MRWYGVAYVLGFVFAASSSGASRALRVRVDADSLLTIMFCVIIGVIVGGRLGYVLFYGEGTISSIPSRSSRSTKAV
ncbi:MAG: prolipoprotein diacylglyceryl transferase family protein [Eggerthella lenta]